MSCPLRRFDDAKLQACERPTNQATQKELADRVSRMMQERAKQDCMWHSAEPQPQALHKKSAMFQK